MAPMAFNDLPNEVIFTILQHLPPSSVPVLDLVSKKFRELANQPVLWRGYCCSSYKYWSPYWRIEEKYAEDVANTDWKSIYVKRHTIDRSTTQEIDSIIAGQQKRLERSAKVMRMGCDTSDTLMKHLLVTDSTEDVLARRYHSAAVLGCLYRSSAVESWAKLNAGHQVPLEEALEAFDMFVARPEDNCIGFVSNRLDDIAKEFQQVEPHFKSWSPRQRVVLLARFLRRRNFAGIQDHARYHALTHNFIGSALRDEEHQCLPLITVAIFCCVAQRLGLDAHPCGFPFHVHAIIRPPQGLDLDGRPLDDNSAADPMYLDPWNSSSETPVTELIDRLNRMNADPQEHQALLAVSSTTNIVQRTARNIMNSIQELDAAYGYRAGNASATFPSIEGAFYGVVWALVMLPEESYGQARVQRNRYIAHLLEHIQHTYSHDVFLIENYVLSRFSDRDDGTQICSAIQDMRRKDAEPIQPKHRPQATSDAVQYKIGQVFRHKRYHYQAMIVGWDVECEAGELWIIQMGVQALPRGRHQAFYHVKVEDGSKRYVAEENIEIRDTEGVSPALMDMAGQYFKRWDNTSNCFVSNIKDEYPDD